MSAPPFDPHVGTPDRWLLQLVYSLHGYGILIYVLLTTLIAAVLASLIGMERQRRGEVAGGRTHALLAVGSALLMAISIWAIRMADGSLDIVEGTRSTDLNYDTSRIAAAVVTGIGFLGGGVIIKDKLSVRGLSTAATLWICTAIGLACGAGFILGAVIATAVVLLTLNLLNRIMKHFDRRGPSILIHAKPDCPIVQEIRELCEQSGLALKDVEILSCDGQETVACVRLLHSVQPQMLRYLSGQLRLHPEIERAEPISLKNHN